MRQQVVLLVFLAAAQTANAAFYDGNQLYKVCSSPEQPSPFIAGYVTGWIDKLEEDFLSTQEYVKTKATYLRK